MGRQVQSGKNRRPLLRGQRNEGISKERHKKLLSDVDYTRKRKKKKEEDWYESITKAVFHIWRILLS